MSGFWRVLCSWHAFCFPHRLLVIISHPLIIQPWIFCNQEQKYDIDVTEHMGWTILLSYFECKIMILVECIQTQKLRQVWGVKREAKGKKKEQIMSIKSPETTWNFQEAYKDDHKSISAVFCFSFSFYLLKKETW